MIDKLETFLMKVEITSLYVMIDLGFSYVQSFESFIMISSSTFLRRSYRMLVSYISVQCWLLNLVLYFGHCVRHYLFKTHLSIGSRNPTRTPYLANNSSQREEYMCSEPDKQRIVTWAKELHTSRTKNNDMGVEDPHTRPAMPSVWGAQPWCTMLLHCEYCKGQYY